MELSSQYLELAKPAFKVPRILLIGLIVSIFVYMYIGYTVANQSDEVVPVNETLTLALTLVAAVTLVGANVFRFYAFSRERLEKKLRKIYDGLKQGALPPLSTEATNTDRVAAINALPLKERTLFRMFAQVFTPFIIIIAMHESVAIYGLILTFRSYDFMEMVPFAVAALIFDFTMFGFPERVIAHSADIIGRRDFEG
ncbi:MAG: hypothetical protein QNJ97_11240 [Myxococcota bacterium]|nr:hypothetical protein [Myxococcota bacterium]